jgi:hypothetical protein
MSAPSSNAAATSVPPPPTAVPAPPQEPLPSPQCLLQAAKLAIAQDKAIQLDYYVDTELGRAFLGEDVDTNEKLLVKSGEEFTSSIQKIYRVARQDNQTDFIIITENSIYLVSGKVQKRRIKAPALRGGME